METSGAFETFRAARELPQTPLLYPFPCLRRELGYLTGFPAFELTFMILAEPVNQLGLLPLVATQRSSARNLNLAIFRSRLVAIDRTAVGLLGTE